MREISYVMDIHRLIAEVRSKPGLWNLHCPQYKDRILIATLWNQVARNVNADVDKCKRKWRNLRDAYRAEIRRIERRMKRDSILGIAFNKNIYKSKWAYFNEMDFMRSYKRRSSVADVYKDNTNSNSDDYDRPDNDSEDTKQFHTSMNIKMEPQDDDMADVFHNMSNDFKHQEFMLMNDEISNDMMFEEFESIEGSESVEEETKIEKFKEEDNSYVKKEFESLEQTENVQELSGVLNSDGKPKNQSVQENSNMLTANKIDCNCLKRFERHFQFQDDLCKKKQRLIATPRRETTDSCNLQHIGDSDYNFLISFLPQIKKMNALQNLQFRAKMSVIVLNTLAP